VVREGERGEMTQALYAHMNNKTEKKKKEMCTESSVHILRGKMN
jgi:hypothetical protein